MELISFKTTNPWIELGAIKLSSLNCHLKKNINAYFCVFICQIDSFLEELVQKDPNYISTTVIGKSFEGRDLKVLRIGNSNKKPIAWVDGGTHAREWLGITTALFIAYQVN